MGVHYKRPEWTTLRIYFILILQHGGEDGTLSPDSSSEGINIHKGGKVDDYSISGDWAYSCGCLLIYPDDYNAFAKAVGFDQDGYVRNMERPDDVRGVVVIDRSLMDTSRADLLDLYGYKGLKEIM